MESPQRGVCWPLPSPGCCWLGAAELGLGRMLSPSRAPSWCLTEGKNPSGEGGREGWGHAPGLHPGCEVWSIPTVLENAQPCAQPCFPPVFLLLSRNAFGRSAVPWLGEGPALWGTVPGVPGGQGVIDPGRLDGPGEVGESWLRLGEFLERQIPAWRGCGCPRLKSGGPWIGMHQGFPFALPFPGVFSWRLNQERAAPKEGCNGAATYGSCCALISGPGPAS